MDEHLFLDDIDDFSEENKATYLNYKILYRDFYRGVYPVTLNYFFDLKLTDKRVKLFDNWRNYLIRFKNMPKFLKALFDELFKRKKARFQKHVCLLKSFSDQRKQKMPQNQ